MQTGVWCAGGSDAPIETCSPWTGIYDAMFRERRAGSGYFIGAVLFLLIYRYVIFIVVTIYR